MEKFVIGICDDEQSDLEQIQQELYRCMNILGEKDIIVKHMWPLTITPPKYKESYILTLMDKFSATKESFEYTVECVKKNQTLKYTYVFLAFILMNFYRKGKFVLATLLKMIWL